MKETKEILSNAAASALVIALPLLSIGGALAAFVYLYSTDPEMFAGTPHFLSILSGVVFLLGFACAVGYSVVFILQRVTKHEVIDRAEGEYAALYEITKRRVLLTHVCKVSANDARSHYWLQVGLSHNQLGTIYNLMCRKDIVVYTLPAFRLPEPLGNVQLKLTHRFVKQLVKETEWDEYVILRWETQRDYIHFGDPLPQATYVSSFDVDRIESHLAAKPSMEIQTYNSDSCINVTAEMLTEWREQLQRSGRQYIQITT